MKKLLLLLAFTNNMLMAQVYSPHVVANMQSDNAAVNNFSPEVNSKIFFAGYSLATGQELYYTNGTTATFVKDIKLGTSSSIRPDVSMINFNNKVYFVATDGITGYELWTSDGTAAGTTIVKDIGPGSSGSIPHDLVIVGSTLYFSIYNGSDIELYKTDGTDLGTVFVAVLTTTGESANGFKAVNGKLCFFKTNYSTYTELWATDGTTTALVKSFNYSFLYTTAVYNNRLFFNANDGVSGNEPWSSDGTTVGTTLLIDIAEGSYNSGPSNFTSCNGLIYFNSNSTLYKSDGTSAGTTVLKFLSVTPSNFQATSNLLFFETNVAKKRNIWRSDGTAAGTTIIKTYSNSDNNNVDFKINQLTNGSVIFTIDDVENGGQEVWKTDGTTVGTSLLKDIRPGLYGSDPLYFKTLGTEMVFSADNGTNGRELWKTNGTSAGTVGITTSLPDSFDTDPNSLTKINNSLFFLGNSYPNTGALFVHIAPNGYTNRLRNSGVSNLAVSNNKLYFSYSASTDFELYALDPANNNLISLVKDINPGSAASNPANLTTMGANFYFTATDNINGRELWKSDGLPGGTNLLKDLRTGVTDGSPRNLVVLNGTTLLFFAVNSSGTEVLWKSDGLPGGTIAIGTTIGTNSNLEVAGNKAYFTSCQGILTGCELWITDGAMASLLKDIRVGPVSSSPSMLTAVGSTLFFIADDGNNGNELWKSDGTPIGTQMVKNINPIGNSNLTNLYNFNGTLYFSADDGVNGAELWKSDGSLGGTVMVKNINPIGSSTPGEFLGIGNTLYFAAIDGKHGRELWKTDGTSTGTVLVYDIFTDKGDNLNNSNPTSLINMDGELYFAATDGYDGRELLKYTPCPTNLSFMSYPSQTAHVSQTISADQYNIFLPKREINYFAGKSILLKPGFSVEGKTPSSNIFRAEIRACN